MLHFYYNSRTFVDIELPGIPAFSKQALNFFHFLIDRAVKELDMVLPVLKR
jgi:hypothetical protein